MTDTKIRSVDEPRQWRMPEIPDDVRAVRDRDGELWTRDETDGSWRHQDDDPDMAGLPEEELLTFGPLVEVKP